MSFQSSFTLNLASSASLDSTSQTAIVDATAREALNIPASTVSFVSASTATSAVRKSHLKASLATTAVIAVTQISIPLSTTNYTDADSLYNALTSALASAVSSGEYSTVLQSTAASLGASVLVNATVTAASFSAVQVDGYGTDDSTEDKKLVVSQAMIWLLMLCLPLLMGMCYITFFRKPVAAARSPHDGITLTDTSNPMYNRL